MQVAEPASELRARRRSGAHNHCDELENPSISGALRDPLRHFRHPQSPEMALARSAEDRTALAPASPRQFWPQEAQRSQPFAAQMPSISDIIQ
jgi:hypothetical protein